MLRLPGRSYRGAPPPLSAMEAELRDRLIGHIGMLAGSIGERHINRAAALERAARYITEQFERHGHSANSQEYAVGGRRVRNIDIEIGGTGGDLLIVGAHYDSVPGCPGANDNGSGVAAVLELSRLITADASGRPVRLVAFVNEEPPFFMTDTMGSMVYARRSRERGEQIAGMFSLETIGYYSSEPRSQQYPGPAFFRRFFPDTGNFIGFVANVASRRLMRDAGRAFRRSTQFPSEGVAAPTAIPGIGWSDHWSFWQYGYPAVMITDTAPYRYPHYHLPSDTPDKLSYDNLARVVVGLQRMFVALRAA